MTGDWSIVFSPTITIITGGMTTFIVTGIILTRGQTVDANISIKLFYNSCGSILLNFWFYNFNITLNSLRMRFNIFQFLTFLNFLRSFFWLALDILASS